MTPVPETARTGREIGKVALIFSAIWTVLIIASLGLGLRQQKLDIAKQAEREAEAIVGMDISFRNWVIETGGIYVAATAKTPADAFLRARDKNIVTAGGQKLTLLSHAAAMRQLSGTRQRLGHPYTSLRSLKPKNPDNFPDEWEQAALKGFENSKDETASLHKGSSIRFIRAFRQDAACLPCHTAEESPGGIRGGISTEVPMWDMEKTGGSFHYYWELGHFALWLAGLSGVLLAYKSLRRAEEDITANEHKYRALFEASRDALMTLEPPSWGFTSGNAATLAMFRAGSEDEFISKGPQDLSPERQPDGRLSSEKAREMLGLAMARGANFFEWTHKRLDGENFDANVLLTKLELKGKAFLQATVRDITEHRREQAEREALVASLKETLAQVKYLSGLIPICAACKKIRNDKGEWETVEHYVTGHSDAKFSHGVCPDCGVKLYGKYYEEKPSEEKKKD